MGATSRRRSARGSPCSAPDVPPAGRQADVKVTTSQIAATIAALVGEDYRTAVPDAAAPLPLSR